MLAAVLLKASNELCRLLRGSGWVARWWTDRLEDWVRGHGVEATWTWDIRWPAVAIWRAKIHEVADHFERSADDRFDIAVHRVADSTTEVLAKRTFVGAGSALSGIAFIDGHSARAGAPVARKRTGATGAQQQHRKGAISNGELNER
jgi:hypothetical protein